MQADEREQRIHELEEEIAALPKGNLSVKRIKGREQPYLQGTENGKRFSRYLKAGERDTVIAAVNRRKQLEEELHSLQGQQGYRYDAGAKSPSGESLWYRFSGSSSHNEYSCSAAVEGSACGSTAAVGSSCSRGTAGMLFRDGPVDAAEGYAGGPDAADRFKTYVVTGLDLQRMCRQVNILQRRPCIRILQDYLTSSQFGRVCLIYGLRRTGKSTMVLQAISDLPVNRSAYIRIMQADQMAALVRDLRKLANAGYQYVFIDEVTLLRDFIDSASLFSDIFGMQGMKIVLSGTDSLGFLLASDDELYDRAVMIHTTFIPFREYAAILDIHDVDEYIRYGGTFRVGDAQRNDTAPDRDSSSFRNEQSTRRYIDTSIARNIQHSLAWYQNGGHFRHLLDLYEADELTGAVNRIIEDMNHQFLLSVLTKDFISHDLGVTVRNFRKETRPEYQSDALELIDAEQVTEDLRRILDIRNQPERRIALTEDHVREIREYLTMLDLIVNCPLETIGSSVSMEHILFSQPGMRFCQAKALIQAMVRDSSFAALSAAERQMVSDRIESEVKGRMLEEIILLETIKSASPSEHVCKLQFPAGEFDMVISDADSGTCRVYEIKHSAEKDPAQYRHLIDEEKCAAAAFQYGTITERCVIYRGPDCEWNGIRYRSAEGYLEGLG